MKDTANEPKTLPRRRFIQTAAAASAAFTILPGGAYGRQRRISANDRVNIAAVGVGGMGRANLQALSSQNIVALCDVDWNYVDARYADIPKQLEQAQQRLEEAGDEGARQRAQAQIDGWTKL